MRKKLLVLVILISVILILLLLTGVAVHFISSNRVPVGEGPVTTQSKKDHLHPKETDMTKGILEFIYYFNRQENRRESHVVSIGSYSGKDILIPESYASSEVIRILPNAFKGSDITSVKMPTSLMYIDEGAFWLCKSLSSVKLNRGLIIIDKNAFYACTSLESISIPFTVQEIGDFAFDMCTSLENITFEERSLPLNIGEEAFARSKIKSISIPKNTVARGNYTFKNCTSLEEVIIEDPATTVLNLYAFEGCTSLDRIRFKGTCEKWKEFASKYETGDVLLWYTELPTVRIICTDGEITYNTPTETN